MEISEFRRAGHDLVDWMADYLANVERLPVTPDVKPGDIRRSLPPSPPQHRRAHRTADERLRPADPARHDALGTSRLLRLLPVQREPAVDARRDAHRRARRAVHVVADVARGHRAGAGHHGVAAPDAGAARGIHRRHPGHVVHRDARGAAHRARARHRLCGRHPWPAGSGAQAHRLRLARAALLGGQGGAARRLRHRVAAAHRPR